MTETPSNLPAVRDERAEVATVDTDSWTHVVADVSKLAQVIADTDFVPKGLRGSAAATAAAILYGREVGLPPMTALTMTHVVEGKPGVSAEAMRALIFAAGHSIEFLESTGAVCTMRGRRRGSDQWTTVTWSLDMARAAGLLSKNNWKSYPRDLLVARCTTSLCRMIFPDVIHGFRSVEELEDLSDDDGAEVEPFGAQPTTSTKVTRKRATAKRAPKSSPPPPEGAASRPEPAAGPPLPGEPGYEAAPGENAPQTAPETPVEGVGDGGAGATPGGRAAAPGEDVELPAPSTGQGDDGGSAAVGAADPPEPEQAEQPRENADDRKPVTRAQQRALMAQFSTFGMSDEREERLQVCSLIVERDVDSTNNLTKREASMLIDTLARFKDRTALYEFLDVVEQERRERDVEAHERDAQAEDGGGS